MTPREALRAVVEAWDKHPTGSEIDSQTKMLEWLNKVLYPTIEQAREMCPPRPQVRSRPLLPPEVKMSEPVKPPVAGPKEWRCFHCDEVFTEERCARDHFGVYEGSNPACVIKAGAEGSLVRALRDAEQAAADAWHAVHNETTDAAKAYYAQAARHRQQLQAAEEAGYERGLRDAMTASKEEK